MQSVRKWLGIVTLAALCIMEMIICAQYAPSYKLVWIYAMLVICCILLDVFVALDYFVIKRPNLKFAAYGADFFACLSFPS